MDIFKKYPSLLKPQFVAEFDFSTCYTVENPEGGISDFDLAIALIRFDANYSEIARLFGRSRREVERAIAADILLFDLAHDVEEAFLDEVESKYRDLARKGDGQAIKFFLSTKAKNRGYTTRSETTGPNGGPLQAEVVSKYRIPDNNRDVLPDYSGEEDAPSASIEEGGRVMLFDGPRDE